MNNIMIKKCSCGGTPAISINPIEHRTRITCLKCGLGFEAINTSGVTKMWNEKSTNAEICQPAIVRITAAGNSIEGTPNIIPCPCGNGIPEWLRNYEFKKVPKLTAEDVENILNGKSDKSVSYCGSPSGAPLWGTPTIPIPIDPTIENSLLSAEKCVVTLHCKKCGRIAQPVIHGLTPEAQKTAEEKVVENWNNSYPNIF